MVTIQGSERSNSGGSRGFTSASGIYPPLTFGPCSITLRHFILPIPARVTTPRCMLVHPLCVDCGSRRRVSRSSIIFCRAARRLSNSHKLSLIGFWSLAFFYRSWALILSIVHPLLDAAIAIVASMMLIIPVLDGVFRFLRHFRDQLARFRSVIRPNFCDWRPLLLLRLLPRFDRSPARS